MLSQPCRPSALNHKNCLPVTAKSHHWNSDFVVLNVFCIIEMTEILIVINVGCEVGKSLETPSNEIM